MSANELLVRMDGLGVQAAGWIATWWLHSAALCALALVAGALLKRGSFRERLYKTALVGALVTSAAQLAGLGVGDALRVELARSEAPARVDDGARGELLVAGAAPRAERSTSMPESSATAPRADGARWRWAHALPLAALLAAALGAASMLRDRRRVARALAGRVDVGCEAWRRDLVELTRRAGLRRAPRLSASGRLASPVALARGELVVPARALAELDGEARRALLAHELAHLARRDPLWLAATALVTRLLALNPLQLVVRRRLAQEMELACDARAVEWLGGGLPLARCLERVAGWMGPGAAALPMASMAARGSALLRRVERALAPAERPASATQRAGFALALGIALALFACAGPKVEPAEGREQAAQPKSREQLEEEGWVMGAYEPIVLRVAPDGSISAPWIVLREGEGPVFLELFEKASSVRGPNGERMVVNIHADGGMTARNVRLYDPADGSFELLDAYLEVEAGRMERRPLDPERPEGMQLAMGELVMTGEPLVPFRTLQKLMERAGHVGIWRLRFGYQDAEGTRTYEVPLPTDLDELPEAVEEEDLPPIEPIDPTLARPKLELTLRVLEPGGKFDPRTGEPWSGSGFFVYDDTRRVEYSVQGLRTESVEALGARLAELRSELPDTAVTVDARSGVVYRDVVRALDAVLEAGFEEVTFVGAYD